MSPTILISLSLLATFEIKEMISFCDLKRKLSKEEGLHLQKFLSL